MPDTNSIVKTLNGLLAVELLAADIYWQQGAYLQYLGYNKLAKQKQDDADEERGHADKLIARILDLGGKPIFSRGEMKPGEDVKGMLDVGLRLETFARDQYTPALDAALAAGDHVTHCLLTGNQAANEEGMVWHRRQLALVQQMGLQNYLTSQL